MLDGEGEEEVGELKCVYVYLQNEAAIYVYSVRAKIFKCVLHLCVHLKRLKCLHIQYLVYLLLSVYLYVKTM